MFDQYCRQSRYPGAVTRKTSKKLRNSLKVRLFPFFYGTRAFLGPFQNSEILQMCIITYLLSTNRSSIIKGDFSPIYPKLLVPITGVLFDFLKYARKFLAWPPDLSLFLAVLPVPGAAFWNLFN